MLYSDVFTVLTLILLKVMYRSDPSTVKEDDSSSREPFWVRFVNLSLCVFQGRLMELILVDFKST